MWVYYPQKYKCLPSTLNSHRLELRCMFNCLSDREVFLYADTLGLLTSVPSLPAGPGGPCRPGAPLRPGLWNMKLMRINPLLMECSTNLEATESDEKCLAYFDTVTVRMNKREGER